MTQSKAGPTARGLSPAPDGALAVGAVVLGVATEGVSPEGRLGAVGPSAGAGVVVVVVGPDGVVAGAVVVVLDGGGDVVDVVVPVVLDVAALAVVEVTVVGEEVTLGAAAAGPLELTAAALKRPASVAPHRAERPRPSLRGSR
jgi:hypothetical protein